MHAKRRYACTKPLGRRATHVLHPLQHEEVAVESAKVEESSLEKAEHRFRSSCNSFLLYCSCADACAHTTWQGENKGIFKLMYASLRRRVEMLVFFGTVRGCSRSYHVLTRNGPPDDVGFIFEALWKKRRFDAEGRRIPAHSCPDVRIPDTVLYKSGYPAQWYFQVGALLASGLPPRQNHGCFTRCRRNSLRLSRRRIQPTIANCSTLAV
jgi:hypothetical protein